MIVTTTVWNSRLMMYPVNPRHPRPSPYPGHARDSEPTKASAWPYCGAGTSDAALTGAPTGICIGKWQAAR